MNYDVFGLSNKQVVQQMGARMQRMRINRQLTQQELAKRTGVSPMTIVGMEAGRNVTLETFVAVLRELGELSTIYELFLKPEPVRPSLLFQAEKKEVKMRKKRVRKLKNNDL